MKKSKNYFIERILGYDDSETLYRVMKDFLKIYYLKY
ncbi:hypothetical protein HMPREF9476_02881 [Clostridium perfringens WAL-14572]|nr:hypothetical protein HMPREF9476_02881 [Clostridium perfringens WAL-14572]